MTTLLTRMAGLSGLANLGDLLTTPFKLSHYLELLHPLWGARQMAKVVSVVAETSEVVTVRLAPGPQWRGHLAGQHVAIGVSINGREHTRTFSIASSPEGDPETIALTIKAVPDGRVTPFIKDGLKRGDIVALSDAQGDFVLPSGGSPIFITGGSGITPVMSMLRTWALRGAFPASVTLLHYAPSLETALFHGELTAIARTYHEFRYRPSFTGRASLSEDLTREVPDWHEREIWACGPTGLLASIADHPRLHREHFAAALRSGAAGTIRFAKSAQEVESKVGLPILLAAESVGIAAAHGCRRGICKSCEVHLLSGCVRDLRTGELTSDPNTLVPICVSAAEGHAEVAL